MERALQRYKDDLDREARYRQKMEERWQTMAEEYEKKVRLELLLMVLIKVVCEAAELVIRDEEEAQCEPEGWKERESCLC